MSEMVNHPEHYNREGLEVIRLIDHFYLDFCLGNAVKYILRAGKKDDSYIQDLKKARWYVNHHMNELTMSRRTSMIYERPTMPLAERYGLVQRFAVAFDIPEHCVFALESIVSAHNGGNAPKDILIELQDAIDRLDREIKDREDKTNDSIKND